MELETFKKLPLGGVDRRAMVGALAEHGPRAAEKLLTEQRKHVRPVGTNIASDTAVLLLGGSNGITRALAVQLVFGEKAAVFGVHLDSLKMQIGVHHTKALSDAASAEGLTAKFFNGDATKPAVIEEIVAELKKSYRAVHLINGIAAGATKRYAEHGETQVKDLDVGFDTVLQVPDFSTPGSIRKVGLVKVEVATAADIELLSRVGRAPRRSGALGQGREHRRVL